MAHTSVIRRSGKLGWLYQAPEAMRAKKSQREETYLRLQLHGREASITWGYHVAAVLSSWRVAKKENSEEWTLTGTAARVDPFCLRQTQPTLLFSAGPAQPCWPIRELGHPPSPS